MPTRLIPNTLKIKVIDGTHFKCYQEKVFFNIDMHKISYMLTKPKPERTSDKYGVWENTNKLCRHAILCTLANDLFNIYYPQKDAKDISDSINYTYIIEYVGMKKFAIDNFLHFKMTYEKSMRTQINDYHQLLKDIRNENIKFQENWFLGV